MSYQSFAGAACVGQDPELFFPRAGSCPTQVAEAKRICSSCPIEQKCRTYANEARERYGTWGAETAAHRLRTGYGRGRHELG